MRDIVEKHLDEVDGVVFDFGGVIVVAPTGEWKVLALCEKAGLSKDAALKGIWKYRNDFDGGFLTCREMYAKILAENGLTAGDDFFSQVYKVDSEGWVNFSPETLELMRELKARGKKLGILSNMSAQFYVDYFKPLAASYRELCDSEIISSQHKLTKPDRPIYDLSEKDMGIPAGRLLFLDDNVANVEAARRYGWISEIYKA